MVTKKLTFCDLNFKKELLGDIHKPRGQLRGEDSLMTILLHIPYLVKVTTKVGGGGVKNIQNFDHVVVYG